jgi:hypothetical protein
MFSKFKFHWNMTRITGTLHDDICTVMITSRWILLRIRNVSDKSCRENENTHFLLNKFFWQSWRLWDNAEKYGRDRQAADDNIIRCRRFACWITRAPSTHTKNIRIIAFSRQQWLHERASMLRSYVYYLSCSILISTFLFYTYWEKFKVIVFSGSSTSKE